MYRDRQLGWAAVVGTALVLVLALASPASAKKFQMSGTWLMRKGQTFIPLQFAGSLGGTQMTHASMGNFTEAGFPPGQTVFGLGGVTTMNNGATLMVPKHRFGGNFATVIPLSGVMLIQITTSFGIDAPYASASLMSGGGPGNFTWCPSNAACATGGAPPGAAPNNGRVRYIAGGNQYGGTMQMGLLRGGLVTVPINLVPFWAGHLPFGGSGTTLRNLAVGGGANDVPTIEIVTLVQGYVTVPTMVPPMGSLILYPGPFLTTGFGNTATMPTGMKFKLPTAGMGAGQYTTNEGFPHTTGTVIAQQNTGTGGDDFFSVMGSNNLNGNGGNISTVAGGLAKRNTSGGDTRYAQFDRVSMTLGAPVPSMSPAGFAAAGMLMLLAVGYALRRRIG